jgi:hypothetical protein
MQINTGTVGAQSIMKKRFTCRLFKGLRPRVKGEGFPISNLSSSFPCLLGVNSTEDECTKNNRVYMAIVIRLLLWRYPKTTTTTKKTFTHMRPVYKFSVIIITGHLPQTRPPILYKSTFDYIFDSGISPSSVAQAFKM